MDNEQKTTIKDLAWLRGLLLDGTNWPIVRGCGMVTFFLHNEADINVLRDVWIEHKTFKQIGRELGLTGATIGCRYRRAFGKLYKRINKAIRDYQFHAEVVAENEKLKRENEALLHRFNSLSQPEKIKFGSFSAITMAVEDMGLGVRAYNCLKSARINTISELLDFSPHELIRFRNFGNKSLVEIEERLRELGYQLPGDNQKK